MSRVVTPAVCVWLSLTFGLAQPSGAGKQQYQALCVGCHGEDGKGGGHGPGIVDVPQPRAISREAIRNVIVNGLPEAGMPAFAMPDAKADAVAQYVMSLKKVPSGLPAPVAPGDAAAGERFFFGKGGCVRCHMVRGRGGVVGPDLSDLGRLRSAAQIAEVLRDPGGAAATSAGRGSPRRRSDTTSHRAVTIRLRDGTTIRGIARNESAFDLQLLAIDGSLRLLNKDLVTEIVREKTLMPKVDANPAELRDLISYLSRLTTGSGLTGPLAGAELGRGVSFADVAHPKPGTWPTYNGSVERQSLQPTRPNQHHQRRAPRAQMDVPGPRRCRAHSRSRPLSWTASCT